MKAIAALYSCLAAMAVPLAAQTSGNNGSHDPSRMIEDDGKLYVHSTGGGMKSSPDGLAWTAGVTRSCIDPGYKPPENPGYALEQGHKEGPYIHYHGGYYYLWWQTGSCCSGASSSYTMHVARSTAVTGPYAGDQVFYASQENLGINGPGHIGIVTCHGQDYFSYHYYPASGSSVIGLNTLTWNASGWPVAGPQTTKGLQLPCGDAAALGPRAAEARPLPMRSGRLGREVRSDAEGTLEIRGPSGRLLCGVHLEKGWNRIADDDLGAGLNIIRTTTAGGSASALIPKAGG